MPFNGTLIYINVPAHPPTKLPIYLLTIQLLHTPPRLTFSLCISTTFWKRTCQNLPHFHSSILLAHPLHTGHQPTPFKLSAHPLLNSDHMTGIPPFMCGPGHSNMLAQTIPKSWPTHYL